jgi:hypothetical protein
MYGGSDHRKPSSGWLSEGVKRREEGKESVMGRLHTQTKRGKNWDVLLR